MACGEPSRSISNPSQELRQRRDGTLEFRLQTSSRKEVTRWILSWMPHVRVLAPRQLRDRVRQRLREGLAHSA
jgi:predicted DNA-binding transcriptional regulator YafY